MKVPYKPIYLPKLVSKRFKYIIIHDTKCQFDGFDKSKIDDNKVDVNDLRSYSWAFDDLHELNYHFFCEKVREDYETFVCRPLNYHCEYDDIPKLFRRSIHICVNGNYDFSTIDDRMYHQVCYRAIAPWITLYGISLKNIFLHSEVSKDSDIGCPGSGFNKNKLISTLQRYVLQK